MPVFPQLIMQQLSKLSLLTTNLSVRLNVSANFHFLSIKTDSYMEDKKNLEISQKWQKDRTKDFKKVLMPAN